MPSIQLAPKATADTAQAVAAGQSPARQAIDPQAQQPAPRLWGGALSRLYPGQLQPRTLNFTPGTTATTAAGAAAFGQARPTMMPKAAGAKASERPWTINGADALTAAQYYSRRRKDGSQGRAKLTMKLAPQSSHTQKAAELSPFAQGFVQGCLSRELPFVAIKVAADNLSRLSADIERDLAPVTKWAEDELQKIAKIGLPKQAVGLVAGAGNWLKNQAVKWAPKTTSRVGKALNTTTGRNITSTLGGAMEGAGAGYLADAFTNNTGMTEDSNWGSLLGAGAGAIGLGRPMRRYLAKSNPGLAKTLYNPKGTVQRTLAGANRLALPVGIGETVGHMAVNRGLERAAQGAGFNNFGEAQQLLQQYNSGDLVGLASSLWGRLSPSAKAGLIGAGTMAGGGLLSGLTGSAVPAQIGTLGGAALMAPAAISGAAQYFQGGQPQAQPAQQALPAPGAASAPLARDEYALQMQNG